MTSQNSASIPAAQPSPLYMSNSKGSAPFSSWLAPLSPASWLLGKNLHLKRSEAVSLVGYGTVVYMFCSASSQTSTLKQLLLLWGCAEAAFYIFQKWRYDLLAAGQSELSHLIHLSDTQISACIFCTQAKFARRYLSCQSIAQCTAAESCTARCLVC